MNYIKKNDPKLVFSRINYIIMLGGIATIFLGFFVMTLDKEEFGFGSLGITIGPIIVAIGFLIEFVAIFYKDKKQD